MDIETSPNLVLAWSCGDKIRISPNQVVQERQIICISYSWELNPKIKTLKWDKKTHSDKKLLRKFIPILNSADIVIGHNGDQFDIKWIKGRLLYHKFKPLSLITSIDTLKLVRKEFNLNSCSLEYLSKYLKIGAKNAMNFSDWKAIVIDNSALALHKMVYYCEQDVNLLKRLYARIKPYTQLPVNLQALSPNTREACRNCGKHTLIKNGTCMSRLHGYIRLRCSKCGASYKGPIIKHPKGV